MWGFGGWQPCKNIVFSVTFTAQPERFTASIAITAWNYMTITALGWECASVNITINVL